LAVREVAPGGAVADADIAGELTQGQVLHASLADGALGLVQECGAEISVVVGALAHRNASLAVEVVIDSIVVSCYIVVNDYF
jgi:hypothetical protein